MAFKEKKSTFKISTVHFLKSKLNFFKTFSENLYNWQNCKCYIKAGMQKMFTLPRCHFCKYTLILTICCKGKIFQSDKQVGTWLRKAFQGIKNSN